MTWVADASVTVAYLLGEASDLERDAMLGDAHAPALLDVEVTQTLRGLLRAAKIDVETAELARAELKQLGLGRHPDAYLLSRAWSLRDLCTVFDALYSQKPSTQRSSPETSGLLAGSLRSSTSARRTDRASTEMPDHDRPAVMGNGASTR